MKVQVNSILESIVFIVKGQILLLIHSSLSVLENRTAFCNCYQQLIPQGRSLMDKALNRASFLG